MTQEAWRAYLELALGMTETSRKKATKAVKRLVGKGGATAEQLQVLAEDLVRTSTTNREALARMIRVELDRALSRLGLASGDEVVALTERVRQLEEQLRAATAAAADRQAPAAGQPEPGAPAGAAAPVEPTAPAAPAAPARKVARKVAKKAVKHAAAPVGAETPRGSTPEPATAVAAQPPAAAPGAVGAEEAAPAKAVKAPAAKAPARKAAAKRTSARAVSGDAEAKPAAARKTTARKAPAKKAARGSSSAGDQAS